MGEEIMQSSENRPGQTRCLLCRVTTFCALCFAVSLVSIFLLLTILFSVLKVPLGIEPMSVGASIAFLFEKGAVPVLALLGEMLRSLSPWGLIVVLVVCIVLWGPAWIRGTLSSSKWELPGGIKFDGTGIPASFQKELGEAERLVGRANKELADAYASADAFASQLRDRHDILSSVSALAAQVANVIGDRCPTDFRLTLYVPDFIFSDRLYQFTGYFDREGHQFPNDRMGRTFSVRYGIIGRVWRSGVPEIEGELIPASEMAQLRPDHNEADLERFIARRWGLSLSEAIRVKKYNSYGALRLQRADKHLGLLYFDSKSKNAFCEPDGSKDLEQRLSKILEEAPLLVKLLEISSEIAPWSGRIQIIRNS